MGDLIDRLRAQNWPTSRNGALLPPRDPPAINIEAADEIAALRERVAELGKATFLTCVSGDGPTPYLKVHFNSLPDAHAAHDAMLAIKRGEP